MFDFGTFTQFNASNRTVTEKRHIHTMVAWTVCSLMLLGPSLVSIFRIFFMRSNNQLASGSEDGSIKLWDAIDGKCLNTITKAHAGNPITSVKFSRNGRYLLSCGLDSAGRLWDMHTGKLITKYEGASMQNQSAKIVFSQSEDCVIGSDDKSFALTCWDTRTGNLLKKIPAHNDVVRSISSNPHSSGLMTCRYGISFAASGSTHF